MGLAAFLVAGCTSKPETKATPTATASATPAPKKAADGLRFRLSQAGEAADSSEPVPLATPTPLSPSEFGPLLSALPPLPAEEGKEFAFRAAPPPPAKASSLTFPAAAAAEKPPLVAPGPLQVLSCSPQGEVEMAAQLQITFNQPMVAVTGLGDLKDPPVKLTPQPAGRWRWLGTQTLVFQPDKRFPMATLFEVEIPEDMASASGAKLGTPKQFRFQTPTLRLEESYPNGGPQPLHPLLFLRFDQDIDAKKLAPELHLRGNSEEIPLRLARREEILQDHQVNALVEGASEKRTLVLALKGKLSPGQAYSMELPAGLHSTEGPLGTVKGQAFSFETYQPLKPQRKSISRGPFEAWEIYFNNKLDDKKWDPKWIRVEPELPDLKVQVSGSALIVTGRPKARSQYKVVLEPALLDEYGQKLGQVETIEVKVGPAKPLFSAKNSRFLTLDPAGKPELSCEVLNVPALRVRAWRVKPEDWADYVKILDEREPAKIPGTSVLDEQVRTGAEADQSKQMTVDLSSAFSNGLGQAIVMVEPVGRKPDEDRFFAWVQSTHLGIDALADRRGIVSWISRLDSGAALADAEVQLLGSKRRERSGPDGLAVLKPETAGTLLVARQGDDLAILPSDFNGYNSGAWLFEKDTLDTLWHVVDDRHLYRPGETVHLKGWLRNLQRGPDGTVQAAPPGQIGYELHDGEGKTIAKGQTKSGGLGGFALELKLPKNLGLGTCSLQLSGPEHSSFAHEFEVQEFRRPEFEVTAATDPGVSQIGKSAVLSATASYFSGGPLANAKVDWTVRSTPTSFSPPGWDGYSFGSWTPWWGGGENDGTPNNYTEREARSDSQGKSQVKIDFLSVDPPHAHTVTAEATVQDVSRQTWTAETSVLVHPSSLYVGLKSDTTFVEKGKGLKAALVVTDLDGKAVAGKSVTVRCYRDEWSDRGELLEADAEQRQITSTAEPLQLEFPAAQGGTYHLEARVQDDQNRANACDLTLWVAGAKPQPATRVDQEQVTLIPGKREYQAGETAEVLVKAPFAPAELLVTSQRDGIASVQRLSAPDGSATVKLPLREMDIPGLTVQVDALGTQTREDGKSKRPAYASGQVQLNMSLAPRRLKVEVKPGREQLQPGQATQVEVQVSDEAGQPVAGVVTFMAVDESVLALSGYDPADPLETFSAWREAGVRAEHSRQFLELEKQLSISYNGFRGNSAGFPAYSAEVGLLDSVGPPAASQPMKDEEARKVPAPAAPPPPPKKLTLRSNFNPLAAFEPYVQTDAKGHAKITFKLPDNLTRYRLIALAQSGVQQFGKGESSLTARKPLQIRPAAPRFLSFGDKFQLGVVLQNQTDEAMQVDLVCRGANALIDSAPAAGYRLELKPKDRREVRIPCATNKAGTAIFQFGANAIAGSDAAQLSLPVWTPATSEAFATYGVLDQGAISQAVARPAEVFPDFGSLSITTSSTALAELTDSLLYLVGYPYECSEQLASRVLSTVALRDVLSAFQVPKLQSPEEIKEAIGRDFARLKALQNDDGGWDYWQRDKTSVPFLSVHVAHMLERLRLKGSLPDADVLDQARTYLTEIEDHLHDRDLSSESKRSIRAYALYVLQLGGKPDPAKARALLKEAPLEQLGPEVLAWLLPTLGPDADILKYLENHSNQTASSAEFSFTYKDQGPLILYSDRRDDALILEALLTVKPNHPLVPKLVRGLLDHRRQGRWENTQENCWVLLAMDAYFQKFEKTAPSFVAKVWLGQQLAGEQRFQGRQKGDRSLEIPMAQVPEKADLVLAKQGKGRLYYRLGMTYAPKNLQQEALDNGFAVERTYEAVQDNRDVRRDDSGVWHIKAGALVRVRLSMQTPARRYQVALVDPLPAGLEALNPDLLGTETVNPPQSRLDGWWTSHWFDHQNLRDERVEAFTQLLWEGVYQYDYVARATTPGEFVAPPTKAEEMYHPETFGRAHSDKVIIE